MKMSSLKFFLLLFVVVTAVCVTELNAKVIYYKPKNEKEKSGVIESNILTMQKMCGPNQFLDKRGRCRQSV